MSFFLPAKLSRLRKEGVNVAGLLSVVILIRFAAVLRRRFMLKTWIGGTILHKTLIQKMIFFAGSFQRVSSRGPAGQSEPQRDPHLLQSQGMANPLTLFRPAVFRIHLANQFRFHLLFTAGGGWRQDRRDQLFRHGQRFPSSVLPVLRQSVASHVPAAPGGRPVY